MIGLTSISFRGLSVAEVIAATKAAGLEGIEWGGDVHVPPGNAEHAAQTAQATRDAGLAVLSYGSYFRLGAENATEAAWTDVLTSASALGAPMIRVWAGEKGSADADAAYHAAVAAQLKRCCAMAAEKGIKVGLEYHRNSLTDTWQSALALLQAADSENLSTYWQPNPDLTEAERLEEIDRLHSHITNVHVFQWSKGNVRHPLEEGTAPWQRVFAKLSPQGRHCILEFILNDDIQQLNRDAQTLRALCSVD